MHSNAIFMLRKLADIVPIGTMQFAFSPLRGDQGEYNTPALFAFDQKQTKIYQINQFTQLLTKFNSL